jgi:hypothetical protein
MGCLSDSIVLFGIESVFDYPMETGRWGNSRAGKSKRLESCQPFHPPRKASVCNVMILCGLCLALS